MERYSASTEERATTGCFLYFQEIGEPPRLRKKPLTGSEQEANQNRKRQGVENESGNKKKPKLESRIKYLRV